MNTNVPVAERGEAAESASAKAYRVLEKMIVTLELAPGRVTTEKALIEKTSLGRTPVREAIQRLAWEGLVAVRPRAGLEIALLHAADWLKVLDARRGIEIILARSAARFATQEIVARLQATALAIHGAVVTGNVIGYLEADKSIGEAMALAADNQFAARLVAPPADTQPPFLVPFPKRHRPRRSRRKSRHTDPRHPGARSGCGRS